MPNATINPNEGPVFTKYEIRGFPRRAEE